MPLSFTPKRSSDRTDRKRVLSDECLGAKLRVTENRCVLFNSLTYVYKHVVKPVIPLPGWAGSTGETIKFNIAQLCVSVFVEMNLFLYRNGKNY